MDEGVEWMMDEELKSATACWHELSGAQNYQYYMIYSKPFMC